jgi:hypothetical protein
MRNSLSAGGQVVILDPVGARSLGVIEIRSVPEAGAGQHELARRQRTPAFAHEALMSGVVMILSRMVVDSAL